MQPRLTRSSVLGALRKFDRSLRGAVEWERWEENKAHKYAILHGGRKYPVKRIAALASGVAVSGFSGGEHPGHANKLLKAVGFKIVPLRGSNPDWVRDELILALDFYLKHRPNPPGKTSTAILDLSKLLNRLGERLFSPSQRSETFRNPNGVYMKLMNFRRLDPQYTAGGKTGLTSGAKEEEEVWEEFAADPSRCEQVARAIIASLDTQQDRAAYANEDLDQESDEAPEGRLLTRQHLARERSRSLVERKKKKVIEETGRLECEACGFDFATRYGKRGTGFIECHHTRPLASLAEGHKTHVKDLAVVCANCHRIIHRGKPWLTVEELKRILVGGASLGSSASGR
jgi:5-methylcytosine-specific restriction protein A